DLAGACRDGRAARQSSRSAVPCRRRRAHAAARHARLAAGPGPHGLYRFAAQKEIIPPPWSEPMRSVLLILCGALIAVGAYLGVQAAMRSQRAAAAPAAAMTGDKAALGKAIREYLIANPEVLVEAMQELERKQDSQQNTAAQKAIQENRAALVSDPDSP